MSSIYWMGKAAVARQYK